MNKRFYLIKQRGIEPARFSLKLRGGEHRSPNAGYISCLSLLFRFLAIVLIAAMMLSVAACAKTGAVLPNDEKAPDAAPGAADSAAQDQPLKGTLTISTCFNTFGLEEAVDLFTYLYPDVEIVLNKYDDDWEKYSMQVSAQLVAGTSDDIMELGFFSLVKLAERGFLADINYLMRDDPGFNEDEYFMNVFRGMDYKGGLFAFPTSFNYMLIGVNNTFPDGFADRFKQVETISFSELLDVFLTLDDRGGRSAAYNLDAITFVSNNFRRFADYESKTAHFNNESFISSLVGWKEATDPQKITDGEIGWSRVSHILPLEHQKESARMYLFSNEPNYTYQIFLPPSDGDIFTHYMPVVTDAGKLIIDPARRYLISESSKNKELAWEFLKFITSDERISGFDIRTAHPVNKEVFRRLAPDHLTNLIYSLRADNQALDGSVPDLVAQIMANVEKVCEMPMEFPHNYYDTMMIEMFGILSNFYTGAVSAEQVASELQNKYSLYLLE